MVYDAPNEYGFYANVNPDVPHPRWSQASERRIGETGRRKTLLFNGYAEQVAHLYEGMDLKANYYGDAQEFHPSAFMLVWSPSWRLDATGLAAVGVSTGNLTVNPIQAATQHSGKYALVFLVLSLACHPSTPCQVSPALKVPARPGAVCLLVCRNPRFIFTGFDYGLDWSLLQGAIFEKRFILVGLARLSSCCRWRPPCSSRR